MDAGQKNLVLNASSLNNFHYTGEIETRRFLCIVLFLHIHITLHTWLEWFQFWSVFLIIFVVVVSCCVHSLTWHARAYNLVVRKWKKNMRKIPLQYSSSYKVQRFLHCTHTRRKLTRLKTCFPHHDGLDFYVLFLCRGSVSISFFFRANHIHFFTLFFHSWNDLSIK